MPGDHSRYYDFVIFCLFPLMVGCIYHFVAHLQEDETVVSKVRIPFWIAVVRNAKRL